MSKRICIARGDGIGPEIMSATLKALDALDVGLEYDELEMGEKVYLRGETSGVASDAWDKLSANRILLKAPITTPQGGGYKSLNVTLRKTLGLYSNIRRSVSYAPVIPSRFDQMDVVIFRENEEDLYAGIEHRQTHEVYQCLKLTSTSGSEKIIRAAFEYAVAHGRKKVTCMCKDNIMKLTDGVFKNIFLEVAKEYPQIQYDHMIIDIGAARLATNPKDFDIIVCQNLYGDILSDIAAQLSGSVGLAGSSNLGDEYAMFEAIHGSAPDIAGKNRANPTGLMLASVEMLHYLGLSEQANRLHHAILKTLEEKKLTSDLASRLENVTALSTMDFGNCVVKNLGQKASLLTHAHQTSPVQPKRRPMSDLSFSATKHLVGVDVFIDEKDKDPQRLATKLREAVTALELQMITNRGVMVWPRYNPATYCTDHWRCRFMASDSQPINHLKVAEVLSELCSFGIDFIKTEGLFIFDGVPGFSLGQGQ